MLNQSSFKFIHAADLHLDSPVRIHRVESSVVFSQLLTASLDSFSDLCTFAITEKVDFIILAGDVYDGIQRGVRAQLRFARELVKLAEAGINVFMVHGNHDPLQGSEDLSIKWPGNLFLFPTTPQTLPLAANGRIYGRITGVSYQDSHEMRNLALQFPNVSDSKLFEIAVLHANIGGSSDHDNYAPASLEDLLSKGYDYWALGHIHKRAVLCDDPMVIYPGNLQGLHMKPSERGNKGAELVEVDKGKIVHSPVSFSKVILEQIEFDVSGYLSIDMVLNDLSHKISELSLCYDKKPLVLRILFTGDVTDAIELAFRDPDDLNQAVVDEISQVVPNLLIESISSEVRPSRSLEDLIGLSDIVGELIDEISRWESSGPELGNESLQDSSRGKVLAGLSRLGLGETLRFNLDDLAAAKNLLSRLLSEEQ